MSEEEMEILEKLSKQNYFGDLPFLYYADLIGKLIANYNKEKEKNEILEDTLNNSIDIRKYWISKDKIKELREIDNIDLIQFKIRELLEERN